MNELLNAIQQAFNNNVFLTETFARGLENDDGADMESLPNCTLTQISGIPEYNTGTTKTIPCLLQFTIRTTDGTQCWNALNAINSTYDHKPLPMPTCVLIDARIIGLNRVKKLDERAYQGDVEYRFEICQGF